MRGHVRKRGKSWSIVYDLGYGLDGKRQQKWEGGFKTKREAETMLAQRISEVENGTFVAPNSQTLGEFLLSWGHDKKVQVRPSTWRSYEWHINRHILPHIGHIKLKDLKAPMIQNFYSLLRNSPRLDNKRGEISERSILHVHLLLNQALDRAVRWGMIVQNPCKLVDSPRPKSKEMTVWSLADTKKFLETAKGDPWYIVYLLLLTTGMRIGEVLGLRWMDISEERATLTVKQQISFVKGGYVIQAPKTTSGKRTIELPEEVVLALNEHRVHQETVRVVMGEQYKKHLDLVCATEKGTPIYRSNITKRWNELIERAGLQRIRIHDARHTHATTLLQQGANPKVVQERLGHAKIDVLLNTYSHVLPGMQRQAIDIYGRNLFKSH